MIGDFSSLLGPSRKSLQCDVCMTCENGFLGVLCVCVWEGRLQVSHSSYLPVAGERESAG